MKYKATCNKKGIVSADYLSFFLVFVPGIIITILMVLIVFLPQIEEGMDNKITAVKEDINKDQFLISYLRSPVQDGNMADLISNAHTNEDYSKLKTETKKLLESLYEEERKWDIFINDGLVIGTCSSMLGCSEDVVYSTFLPTNSKENNVINFKLKVYK